MLDLPTDALVVTLDRLGPVRRPFQTVSSLVIAATRPVAVASVEKLSVPEQSIERIERCGHVKVTVGVDTTGDPAHSFYDGRGHRFLSKV